MTYPFSRLEAFMKSRGPKKISIFFNNKYCTTNFVTIETFFRKKFGCHTNYLVSIVTKFVVVSFVVGNIKIQVEKSAEIQIEFISFLFGNI